MSTTPLRTVSSRLRLLIPVAACALLCAGCVDLPESVVTGSGPEYSKALVATSPCTGHLLSGAQVLDSVPMAFLGDIKYAEVNSSWLPLFYRHYQAELFRSGIMKWDERFTCKHFAAYYTAMAQATFYYTQFHTFAKADTLAIGIFWYIRQDGRGHAIVVALTERGPIYIEPQNGKEIVLTAAERSSALLKIF